MTNPYHQPAEATESVDARTLAGVAADSIDAKKGGDVVMLDMTALIGITDVFLIASGQSRRQVQTLADEVRLKLKEQGRLPLRVEGLGEATWVLLDYGDLVVHLFQPETRQYYELERLWADAPRIPWSPVPSDG